jgi:hypothetical protein
MDQRILSMPTYTGRRARAMARCLCLCPVIPALERVKKLAAGRMGVSDRPLCVLRLGASRRLSDEQIMVVRGDFAVGLPIRLHLHDLVPGAPLS